MKKTPSKICIYTLSFLLLGHSCQLFSKELDKIQYNQLFPNAQTDLKSTPTLTSEPKVKKVIIKNTPYLLIENKIGKIVAIDVNKLDEETLENSYCLTGKIEEKDLLNISTQEIDFQNIKNFKLFISKASTMIEINCPNNTNSIYNQNNPNSISIQE